MYFSVDRSVVGFAASGTMRIRCDRAESVPAC